MKSNPMSSRFHRSINIDNAKTICSVIKNLISRNYTNEVKNLKIFNPLRNL